jgi:hypothetical protein
MMIVYHFFLLKKFNNKNFYERPGFDCTCGAVWTIKLFKFSILSSVIGGSRKKKVDTYGNW